jgi:hypothetical protein
MNSTLYLRVSETKRYLFTLYQCLWHAVSRCFAWSKLFYIVRRYNSMHATPFEALSHRYLPETANLLPEWV